MFVWTNVIFFLCSLFSWGVCPALFSVESLVQQPQSSEVASHPVGAQAQRIVIHNRPLAKINGRVITLRDVVKYMNFYLFQRLPHIASDIVQTYHFYSQEWQHILEEIVSNELILLDADSKSITVYEGAVREEMIRTFGPNIMATLDRLQFSYEEAKQFIQQQLMIKKLLGTKVHAKVFSLVTPDKIRETYQSYLTQTPSKEYWTYQVLSIRGNDSQCCQTKVQQIQRFLENRYTFKEIFSEFPQGEEGVTLFLSEDYTHETRQLSKEHHAVLKELSTSEYSLPIVQNSHRGRGTVTRFFHLKEKKDVRPLPFQEIYHQLADDLLFQLYAKEKSSYVKSLKKRYHYDEGHVPLPEGFCPFSLSM